MTKLEEVIRYLEMYKRHADLEETREVLQLAIDVISVRRVITWLCESCGQAVTCAYIRYDPSVYRMTCPHCHTTYDVLPGKNDYQMSEVTRVKGEVH